MGSTKGSKKAAFRGPYAAYLGMACSRTWNLPFGNISDFKTGKERYCESDKLIFIVSYARSGSTFTGSIFREFPGSFYIYEPRKFLTTFKEDFGDDRRKSRIEVLVSAINSWVCCNLSSLCLPGRPGRHSTISSHGCCGYNGSLNFCLQAEENYCRVSPVMVMKFVCLRMRYMLTLLRLFPNIKVIHLVRDPRGVMNSRFLRSSIQELQVKSHCETVLEDLKYSKYILRHYPDKLLIVQYENLADDPIKTTRQMFEFAGLDFTDGVKTYLENQTNAKSDTCRHCTARKNSSQTAMQWRKMLDSKTALFIYQACRKSNEILGYLPLSSEQSMKDYKIESRKLVDIQQNLFL